MELTRGQETIQNPCKVWVDENGKAWDNPQLPFLLLRGFAVILELPVPPLTDEELRIAAIPYEITMRQARLALRGAGILDAVNALVATLSGEDQDTWEYSSMVQRNHPLVSYVATQAGWTVRQMDDLFTLAATK